MNNVAAGKNPRRRGFHVFKNNRSVRSGIDPDSRRAAQFVFRDQSDGKQQRITIEMAFGAGNRTAIFIYGGNSDAAYPAV